MSWPTLSVIVPTVGEATLARALRSLHPQTHTGDEVLLVADGPSPGAADAWDWAGLPGRFLEMPGGPHRDWGHAARNWAMPQARGRYLAFLDADDEMLPGALALVRAALAEAPGRPHLFRMEFAGGARPTVWQDREVRETNLGTPCFVVPNDPARLGVWGSRYEGDFDFIASTLAHYPDGPPVWREEVICLVYPAGGE
jgi:glycosyltransferase involved in cell wall biosynthesis